MGDFLDRYGEQLKRARQRRRWRRVRDFAVSVGSPARTARLRPRSTQQAVAAGFGAVALLAAVLTLAFTRSTTPVPSPAPVDVAAAPPENEALEHLNGFSPDEFKDFQLSSNAEVTRAQVDRMQAQAAAV